MPVPTVPMSLAVTVHASTVSAVEVHAAEEDRSDRAQTVALILTDAGGRSHVTVLGSLADVHRLIIEADRQLARLAREGE